MRFQLETFDIWMQIANGDGRFGCIVMRLNKLVPLLEWVHFAEIKTKPKVINCTTTRNSVSHIYFAYRGENCINRNDGQF